MKIDQFAAMNMVYQRYSFEYFLKSMDKQGIKSFEFWTGGSHLNIDFDSLSDVKSFKREIDAHELRMVCLTPEQVTYPYNIAAADKELREKSLEYFFRYIDVASELGIDKLLCCSGWGDYDEPREEAWKRSVDGLWKMTEYANKKKVVLAFEILQAMETNLVNDFETTKRMMDTIKDPYFKLCVDLVPVRVNGNTLLDYFNEFGDRICHIHLTDGDLSGHVPLGLGSTPVKEHLETLDKVNYQGDITLEIGDSSWWADPEKATEIGFTTLKKVLVERQK